MRRAVWFVGLVCGAMMIGGAAQVSAEPFSKPQIACVISLQAVGEQVARLVVRQTLACANRVAHGRLQFGESARACIAADPGRRLARAQRKAVAVARKRCAVPPPFGPSDGQLVGEGMADPLRLANVFGAQLERSLYDNEIDRDGARCQGVVVHGLGKLAIERLLTYRTCTANLLRTQSALDVTAFMACMEADPKARVARVRQKLFDKAAKVCPEAVAARSFRNGCRAGTLSATLDCATAEVRCGTCLALQHATALDGQCDAIPGIAPNTLCRSTLASVQTVARQWDEEVLSAIRLDLPRPTVHARNLFHLSAAMWDAWAAYDNHADQYLHHEKRTSVDVARDRATTISYAAYRLLRQRYIASANSKISRSAFDDRMKALGYDIAYDSVTDDSPAALGNRIAATILAAAANDNANENGSYTDPTYMASNAPLVVKNAGTNMAAPNNWQPLALEQQAGQNGVPIPGKVQVNITPQWGNVTPFAMERLDPLDIYFDPGPPPQLAGTEDALLKADVLAMLRADRELTVDDGAMIDLSPASRGNNTVGTNDGHGYAMNPITGAPYAPTLIKRGDFTRSIVEYWQDGPTAETSPGHWNVIANRVSDDARLVRKVQGEGLEVDRLEWDVKVYFALNAALHDAAIQCWGVKRRYDSVRPISTVRHMGELGQSSDSGGQSYNPSGLPLEPGLVEVITSATTAPGARHAALAGHEGEIAVLSWPGQPADPLTQTSGVQWVRAVDWVPFQRKTFVTPPYAGFSAEHSTFSRAAAEVLTRITGSEYFPGGLGEYILPMNGYLQFERGPSTEVRLQWARYYDAADQSGLSRVYAGTHLAHDDLVGRTAGAQVGALSFDKSVTYFEGTAQP